MLARLLLRVGYQSDRHLLGSIFRGHFPQRRGMEKAVSSHFAFARCFEASRPFKVSGGASVPDNYGQKPTLFVGGQKKNDSRCIPVRL